jgi:hypothetical protein
VGKKLRQTCAKRDWGNVEAGQMEEMKEVKPSMGEMEKVVEFGFKE